MYGYRSNLKELDLNAQNRISRIRDQSEVKMQCRRNKSWCCFLKRAFRGVFGRGARVGGQGVSRLWQRKTHVIETFFPTTFPHHLVSSKFEHQDSHS